MSVCSIFNPGHVLDEATIVTQNAMKRNPNTLVALSQTFLDDPCERNFNTLMKKCMVGLRKYINSIVRDNEDTDIVLSFAMERTYFGIDRFSGDASKLKSWMYRIAHNEAITFIRQKKSKHVSTTDIESVEKSGSISPQYSAYDNMYDDCDIENISFDGKTYKTYTKPKVLSDMYDASVKCMRNLPKDMRVVMQDRFLNRKKVDDISRDNMITSSNVKNLIRKGCDELSDDVVDKYKELCFVFGEMHQN